MVASTLPSFASSRPRRSRSALSAADRCRHARRGQGRGQGGEIQPLFGRQAVAVEEGRKEHPVAAGEGLPVGVEEEAAAGGEAAGLEQRHQAPAGVALAQGLQGLLDRRRMVGEVVDDGDAARRPQLFETALDAVEAPERRGHRGRRQAVAAGRRPYARQLATLCSPASGREISTSSPDSTSRTGSGCPPAGPRSSPVARGRCPAQDRRRSSGSGRRRPAPAPSGCRRRRPAGRPPAPGR